MLIAGVLLPVLVAGCSPDAGAGPPPLRIRLHTAKLPAPPESVTVRLGGHRPIYWGPLAVDAAGNILVDVANNSTGNSVLIRFDPRRKRWLPGALAYPDRSDPGTVLGVGSWVWPLPATSSVWRGQFSGGWSLYQKVLRIGGGGGSRIFDRLAANRQGRVWVAGYGGYNCGVGEAGVTNYGCGYSFIEPANLPSGRTSPVRANRQGKESAIAVNSKGSVWLVVPQLKRCQRASCNRPALLRYDPSRRRFIRYPVPPKIWPVPEAKSVQPTYGDTTDLFVRPNGVLWLVAFDLDSQRKVRLIQFHGGSFSAKILHIGGPLNLGLDALIDRHGDLWFSGLGTTGYGSVIGTTDTEYVIDPATGASRKLSHLRGTILPDSRGKMWYVKAPSDNS